jgi:hypothetical protein
VATIYYVATPDRAPRERREQESPFDFKQPDMAAEVMAEKLQNSIQSQKAQMQAIQQRIEMLESKQQRGTTATPLKSSNSQFRARPSGVSLKQVKAAIVLTKIYQDPSDVLEPLVRASEKLELFTLNILR